MTGHPELVEGCRDVCANNYVVMYDALVKSPEVSP